MSYYQNGPRSITPDIDSDLFDLRLHHYDPDARVYASRIKGSEWQKHKPFLRKLHVLGATRRQMLVALANRGFHPTMNQLHARMSAWDFKVYGGQGSGSRQARGGSAILTNNDPLVGISSASPSEISSLIAAGQPEQETDIRHHHEVHPIPAVDEETDFHHADVESTPTQNKENVQADRISDSLSRLQTIYTPTTAHMRPLDEPPIQWQLIRHSKEMDEGAFMGYVKAEDQREGSEIFEAQQVKICYEPPPESLSWGSRSSWSFYKVTLFSRSDPASVTTSHSDVVRKKGKTKPSDADDYRWYDYR